MCIVVIKKKYCMYLYSEPITHNMQEVEAYVACCSA